MSQCSSALAATSSLRDPGVAEDFLALHLQALRSAWWAPAHQALGTGHRAGGRVGSPPFHKSDTLRKGLRQRHPQGRLRNDDAPRGSTGCRGQVHKKHEIGRMSGRAWMLEDAAHPA